MKRNLLLIAIILLVVSLVGCDSSEVTLTKEPERQTKEVILNKSNLEDYFNVNVYTDSYSESHSEDFMGFDNYSCSCTLHIVIDKLYEFEIQEPIDLDFGTYTAWESISGSTNDGGAFTINVKLPVSGSTEQVYTCSTTTYWSLADSMPQFSLENVHGSVYVYE